MSRLVRALFHHNLAFRLGFLVRHPRHWALIELCGLSVIHNRLRTGRFLASIGPLFALVILIKLQIDSATDIIPAC